jgi:prepilin-type processing-associated H-X9-DG protein
VAFADAVSVKDVSAGLVGIIGLYPYYTPAAGTLKSTVPGPECAMHGNNMAFPHNGNASVGWADGHVSAERMSFANAKAVGCAWVSQVGGSATSDRRTTRSSTHGTYRANCEGGK